MSGKKMVEVPVEDGTIELEVGTPVEVVDRDNSAWTCVYYVDEEGVQVYATGVGDDSPVAWRTRYVSRVLTEVPMPKPKPKLPTKNLTVLVRDNGDAYVLLAGVCRRAHNAKPVMVDKEFLQSLFEQGALRVEFEGVQ